MSQLQGTAQQRMEAYTNCWLDKILSPRKVADNMNPSRWPLLAKTPLSLLHHASYFFAFVTDHLLVEARQITPVR